ncbi:MAG: rubredoxin [Eubacteriaceae bacterium]|nr:rubredoxin [Eubacteriaceae bacterium]
MNIFICGICGYVYNEIEGDPAHGIGPFTEWGDLPEDFECPLCGNGKSSFDTDYIEI